MDELELSVMQQRPDSDQLLRPFLDSFEARHRHRVHVEYLDWDHGRADLTKMALYHHGADVSEIGTTWIGDLIAMNALRPFSAMEVIQTGPAEAFLPTSWKTTQVVDQSQVWSIPWLAEAFTLHYRMDIIDQAGLDPSSAFSTPAALLDTVRRLKSLGHALPIALPPVSARSLSLHIAASWVWQAGGDFLSPDGRQVTVNEQRSAEALVLFFKVLAEIQPEGIHKMDTPGVAPLFWNGETPLAISGMWLHPRNAPPGSIDPSVWGVAQLPGPPFVGGSNLVIWKHTRQDRAALSLVQTLASETASATYADGIGKLPTRLRLANSAHYQNDRFLRTVYESIQQGRSYPTFSLWGLVEDRLKNMLASLWDGLQRDPDTDLDEAVPRALNQLARSLNLTLSQR